MPRFSPELRPLPTPELTGPAGEAGAEDEEAADEGARTADASGPILGAQPMIIQTGARLEGKNMLKVVISV